MCFIRALSRKVVHKKHHRKLIILIEPFCKISNIYGNYEILKITFFNSTIETWREPIQDFKSSGIERVGETTFDADCTHGEVTCTSFRTYRSFAPRFLFHVFSLFTSIVRYRSNIQFLASIHSDL